MKRYSILTLLILITHSSICSHAVHNQLTMLSTDSRIVINSPEIIQANGKLIPKQEASSIFDEILNYIKQILTICLLISGLILGKSFYSKMKEEYLKSLLFDLQKSNKVIREFSQKLLSQYAIKASAVAPIKKEEAQETYTEINALYLKSIDCSIEVATLLFYLNNILLRFNQLFPVNGNYIITTREYYSFISIVLSKILFFSTKVVTIPKNATTKKVSYLIPELQKYSRKEDYKKYKHLEQGLNMDKINSITIGFCSHVMQSKCFLIYKAGYEVVYISSTLLRGLYINRIYFPLSLLNIKEKSPFGEYILSLVGFKSISSIEFNTEKSTDYVLFYYSSSDAGLNFIDSLKEKDLKEKFRDNYFNSDSNYLDEIVEIKKYKPEILELKIKRSNSEEYFNSLKIAIEKRMKKEMND